MKASKEITNIITELKKQNRALYIENFELKRKARQAEKMKNKQLAIQSKEEAAQKKAEKKRLKKELEEQFKLQIKARKEQKKEQKKEIVQELDKTAYSEIIDIFEEQKKRILDYFKVTEYALMGECKDSNLPEARRLLAYLTFIKISSKEFSANEKTDAIGKLINKHRTTIYFYISRTTELIKIKDKKTIEFLK